MNISYYQYHQLQEIHRLSRSAVSKFAEGVIQIGELETYLKGLFLRSYEIYPDEQSLWMGLEELNSQLKAYSQGGHDEILSPTSSASISHLFEPYDEWTIIDQEILEQCYTKVSILSSQIVSDGTLHKIRTELGIFNVRFSKSGKLLFCSKGQG